MKRCCARPCAGWTTGSKNLKTFSACTTGENYPRASREKFSALRKRLRSDFRRQHDLFLDRDGIRLLAGPGYWVSCFIKSYERKGQYHHGLQALYWIPDDLGEYHIIGEVWINN